MLPPAAFIRHKTGQAVVYDEEMSISAEAVAIFHVQDTAIKSVRNTEKAAALLSCMGVAAGAPPITQNV